MGLGNEFSRKEDTEQHSAVVLFIILEQKCATKDHGDRGGARDGQSLPLDEVEVLFCKEGDSHPQTDNRATQP